jgi:hypothetical protein
MIKGIGTPCSMMEMRARCQTVKKARPEKRHSWTEAASECRGSNAAVGKDQRGGRREQMLAESSWEWKGLTR